MKVRYRALVYETRARSVEVEVEIPDGKSPWGPAARKAAEAAILAAPVTEWQEPRTKVQLTQTVEV